MKLDVPSSHGFASVCAVCELCMNESTPLPSEIDDMSRSKKTDSPPTMLMSALSRPVASTVA